MKQLCKFIENNLYGYYLNNDGVIILTDYNDWREDKNFQYFSEITRDECFILKCQEFGLDENGNEII